MGVDYINNFYKLSHHKKKGGGRSTMHLLPNIRLYVKRGIVCDLIRCYELKFIMKVCKSCRGKFLLMDQQC